MMCAEKLCFIFAVTRIISSVSAEEGKQEYSLRAVHLALKSMYQVSTLLALELGHRSIVAQRARSHNYAHIDHIRNHVPAIICVTIVKITCVIMT